MKVKIENKENFTIIKIYINLITSFLFQKKSKNCTFETLNKTSFLLVVDKKLNFQIKMIVKQHIFIFTKRN